MWRDLRKGTLASKNYFRDYGRFRLIQCRSLILWNQNNFVCNIFCLVRLFPSAVWNTFESSFSSHKITSTVFVRRKRDPVRSSIKNVIVKLLSKIQGDSCNHFEVMCPPRLKKDVSRKTRSKFHKRIKPWNYCLTLISDACTIRLFIQMCSCDIRALFKPKKNFWLFENFRVVLPVNFRKYIYLNDNLTYSTG